MPVGRPFGLPAPLPLPRRIIRHLLFAHGLNVGSRVVMTGQQIAPLVALWERLGVDVTLLPALPTENVTTPTAHAALWLLGETTRSPGGAELTVDSLNATARLLSHVKPGGVLLLVTREDGGTENLLGQHLGAFAGRCVITRFAAPSWRAWLPGQQGGATIVASLQRPPSALEPPSWNRAILPADNAPPRRRIA